MSAVSFAAALRHIGARPSNALYMVTRPSLSLEKKRFVGLHNTRALGGSGDQDSSGAALVEAAGALALLFPLLVLLTYVVIEVSYAYVISASLSAAAHQAARNLVIAYWKNSDIAGSRALQDTEVFDHIRIQNILNDSRQFQEATFQTASNPPSVLVTVRYLGGQYGLPPFPNPDPLRLGSFQITASAASALD
ncbi:MAG: hypothetical protein HY711_04350 [Candidatus Melainabacteria bacterium]|nr:hypothetical protein [Candidatus Melainabacteria bacterium]